jgi:DNA-binding NarL/FixJ family response regulator
MRSLFLIKEPLLVEGLSTLLSKMVNELSLKVAQDEKEGEILQLASEKSFDLFVLDTESYKEQAIDLIRVLKNQMPHIKIIFIYARLSREILSAYRAGISGSFFRGDSLDTIKIAFQTVLNGEVYVPHTIIINLICEGHLFFDMPDLINLLSQKEIAVLKQLRKGQRMKEVAQSLSMAPSTLSTHKLRIAQKLNLVSDSDFDSFLIAYENLQKTSAQHPKKAPPTKIEGA